MADTKLHQGSHHASLDPVEGDGISYSGIVWFVVILVVTTVVCQILMVVLFKALDSQAKQADASTTMAACCGRRLVSDRPLGPGVPEMVEIGRPNGPTPRLLVQEPVNLETLRAHEHEVLTTYGWADKNAGTFRIPIDRAKDLIIERGLPVRTTDASKDGAAKEVKVVKEVKK
jgi:hypothetical protein